MENYGIIFEQETEQINGATFVTVHPAHGILQKQREALKLTQQQVAGSAGINIRQYQRYESGERSLVSASFRIGVAICQALKLNPFEMV